MQFNNLDRNIRAKVKKGSFASVPAAPELQRDTDAHELGIADLTINNGDIEINQSAITDLRLNSDLCGIVQGLIDQVDTTTIFNQYLSWFNETKTDAETNIENIKTEFESDFNNWFSMLQGVLSGDVAGNLLVKIENLITTSATAPAIPTANTYWYKVL